MLSKTKITAYRRLARQSSSILDLRDAVVALCDAVDEARSAFADLHEDLATQTDRAHPVPCQDCGGSTPCRCATGEG